MKAILRGVLTGFGAGAAGTTALDITTYLDMAIRGRPASSTPEETVARLAELLGVRIPGNEESRRHRVAGLGPLTGAGVGVGMGGALGLLRGLGLRPPMAVSALLAFAGAMVMGNGPMAALGVTDPRSWDAKAWLSDVVPHLVYGAVTAAVLSQLDHRPDPPVS